MDKQFADIEVGDFSLPENSPAFKVGFRAIDTGSIGLQSPWKEKLLGINFLQTRIAPPTQRIESGVRVKIQCSQRDAIIRYTVDGREPTETYTSSLRFDETVTIRAKAFKAGLGDVGEKYASHAPRAGLGRSVPGSFSGSFLLQRAALNQLA